MGNRLLLLLALACLGAGVVRGQPAREAAKPPDARAPVVLPPEKTGPVRLARFDARPVIDGQLNENVWAQAAVLKDFYQVQPGDNIPPSCLTEVLLGFDSTHLYVGFRAHDEANKVRVTVAKRDGIFDDDNVGMFLDTFNDQRRAYVLYFNAHGVQADGILTEGVGEDYSVDVVMESKGLLTDAGYTVEVAIPFKSLRYESGEDRPWGVHFFRRVKRHNDELSSWMPLSRDRSGWLNQAGHIVGLEGLSAGRTLEIIPSLTLSETGRRVRTLPHAAVREDPTLADPGRFLNPPLQFDPGLTAKLGISSKVILDLAVNPDFAQVEADETVVTANQRFPIFFEEKRPFFLEGVDIFQTPIQAVHTRTIVDPDVAVKLTGKRGRDTFGIMLASDKAPGNYSEDERADPVNFRRIARFLDKNAHVAVLRLKRDVGEESNIGMIATAYSFIEKHNYLGGVDGRFRLDPQTVFSFQAVGTHSRRPFFDSALGRNLYRTGNGFGYTFNLDRTGRHFSYQLNGQGRTRDYRADVGFTRRINTNLETLTVGYKSEPKPEARLISWKVQNRSLVRFDWNGRMQGWEHYPQITFNLRRQSFITLYAFGGYERLVEEEFGPQRTPLREGAFIGDSDRHSYYKGIQLEAETNPSRKYSLYFETYYNWGAFDFDFGSGPRFPRVSPAALLDPDAPLDPGPGRDWYAKFVFTYQPTETLRMSLDYTKSRLVRNDTGRTAFDSNIYVLRATYQFTRFAFARARLDYDTLAARVRGQTLFGWSPNPGTSFYVGYNDDLSHNSYNPFNDVPSHFEPGFRRNGRTFFVKASYLFRRQL
jgi:Domain of unknown function (DUF5916)/Carbohydrate family 9 binding domain-like